MTAEQDFWSRRKAAVLAEEEAEAKAVEDEALAEQLAEQEEKSDAEILAELNLPDPDLLEPGQGISGFMSQAVPERIRRRALRQLWRLNPALANLDGMVDYGEDFTDAACVVENMQTTYQVGKGMLAHLEEMARKAALEETGDVAEETDTPVADTEGPDPVDPVTAEAPPPAADTSQPHETKVWVAQAEFAEDTETEILAPVPRRMRFEFEG